MEELAKTDSVDVKPMDTPEPATLRGYRFAWQLAGPFVNRYLRKRVRRGKEDPNRLSERKGVASLTRPPGRLIWIHAASIGESLASLPLIDLIGTHQQGTTVLLTTGTVTSARMLEAKGRSGFLHQYAPLDHPDFVTQFLDTWKPQAALFLESEIWPNTLCELSARQIPIGLINGRITEKSFRGWRRFGKTSRYLFDKFKLCIAQDGKTVDRLNQLGATSVLQRGNLKLSAPALPDHLQKRKALGRQIGGRPVWLASQTGDGEEVIIGEVHKRLRDTYPDLLTIVAPRHPDRAYGILRQLAASSLIVAQRSEGDAINAKTDIYLADTVGELGFLYRLVPITFLGRSLSDKFGGSNPLEPARLDCAILQGPHTINFSEINALLKDQHGYEEVGDEEALFNVAWELLADPARQKKMSKAASNAAQHAAGAAESVYHDIAPLLTMRATEKRGRHARA